MITAVFSYLLIPLSTLFLARGTGLFTTNFSSIGTHFSRREEFLLWGLLTGGYFFFSMRPLLQRLGEASSSRPGSSGKWLSPLLYTAGIAMLFFLLIPYRPEHSPLWSAVHVLSALLSSVLLLLCLFTLSLAAYWRNPKRGRPFLLLLIASVSFCLSSWILSGIINTAMEICLVFTACHLICRLSRSGILPGPD